ncbi:MAG: acetyl-CoA carboxylase biotin carboxyl carrier protein [Brevundimonas sp.]|jgi:acetyl-CoA carboxylase biotin carboxyl carrier protein|uniref:acetyl-CoA carboxylase biotin carboxyl carrier protein n=1 Tax=Brevundimonas sp. TaxID=1871086 RepID=UPI003918C242
MATSSKTGAGKAAPAPRRSDKAEGGTDATFVRQLAEILNDTDLTEIEVERGDLRVRVAREVTVAAAPVAMSAPGVPMMSQPAPPATPTTAPAAAAPAASEAPAQRGEPVKSPMVGTAYLQPQPGADPFVSAGDRVKSGQTLLIVEAMKTMNPITAPRDGVVLEVLVGDSQPVQFGEPLVILE